MATFTTYTAARATFKKLCDEVVETREPVIIQRRNGEDVALVSANDRSNLPIFISGIPVCCNPRATLFDTSPR